MLVYFGSGFCREILLYFERRLEKFGRPLRSLKPYTLIRHTEFCKEARPGSKWQLLRIMSSIPFSKNLYTYLFTKKEYITVLLTSTIQRQ